MKRSEFLARCGAAAGVAALATGTVFGQETAAERGGSTMARFGDVVIPPEKQGKEKHVPHIEAPSKVKAGEPFEVTVIVGKEIAHPNTIAHHIKWIQLYAKEEGKPVAHVATIDLGPTYAAPRVTLPVMLTKSSTLYALEYCSLHGVWDNSVEVAVE